MEKLLIVATKEIMILNRIKHNKINSPKVKACIRKELKQVKNSEFVSPFLTQCERYGYHIDTVYIDLGEEKEQEDKEKAGPVPDPEISPAVKSPDPITFYQENIGVIPPHVVEDMTQWMDGKHFDEPNEIIVEAIRETVTNGARGWKYTTKILIGWADRGLRTLKQVQAAMLEHEQSKGKGYRQGNKDNPSQSGFDKRAAADKAFLESMQSGQAFVEKDTGYDPPQDQELEKLMDQLHTK